MHSQVGVGIGATAHLGEVAAFGLAKLGLGEEGRGVVAADFC